MATLFKWTSDNKMTSITRSHFDALHGRVSLALKRLEGLAGIFPQDPDVALAEAVVRLDYIGQSEYSTRDLFEKTYRWGQNDAGAAKNLTLLARSAEEFRKWVDISLPLNSKDLHFKEQVNLINESLSEGYNYWHTLLYRASSAEQQQDYGTAAALAAVSLLSAREMGNDSELAVRRTRAKCLRELDKFASNKRSASLEPALPEERLALQAAVAEIDEVLRLDEYDPEMWNFKSAWCSLLHRFDEADASADRAMTLRPHGYPKPLLNKADARMKQRNYKEALVLAQKALNVAQGTPYKSDILLAERIIHEANHPPQPLSADDLPQYTFALLKAADNLSDEEIGGHGPVNKLVNGVLIRLMNLESPQSANTVMAELASDFTPETVGRILVMMRSQDRKLFGDALQGLLHTAVNSQGAFQRDTVRILILTMLRSGKTTAIRDWCRGLVLIPSQADPNLPTLEEVVKDELKLINRALPDLVTQQPPPTEAEKQQYRSTSERFQGLPVFLYQASRVRSLVRFLGIIFIGMALIIGLVYYLVNHR